MAKFILILTLIFIFLLVPTNDVWASSATLKKDFAQVGDVDYKKITTLYNFLGKYDSPLKGYSRNFVEEAGKHDLDWRLLVAISGVESTFGKQIPYNSYNAWGWGIYGNNTLRFTSYPEAITTISKALRENYIDSWGAKNVYQIGRIYAASPTWAQRVDYFMGKIEEDSLQLSL